jgi:hypothetical protein
MLIHLNILHFPGHHLLRFYSLQFSLQYCAVLKGNCCSIINVQLPHLFETGSFSGIFDTPVNSVAVFYMIFQFFHSYCFLMQELFFPLVILEYAFISLETVPI